MNSLGYFLHIFSSDTWAAKFSFALPAFFYCSKSYENWVRGPRAWGRGWVVPAEVCSVLFVMW